MGGTVTPLNSTVSQAKAAQGRVRGRRKGSGADTTDLLEGPVNTHTTPELVVIIGAGSMGQAIARRIGVGKTILLADLNEKAAATAAARSAPSATSTARSTMRQFKLCSVDDHGDAHITRILVIEILVGVIGFNGPSNQDAFDGGGRVLLSRPRWVAA